RRASDALVARAAENLGIDGGVRGHGGLMPIAAAHGQRTQSYQPLAPSNCGMNKEASAFCARMTRRTAASSFPSPVRRGCVHAENLVRLTGISPHDKENLVRLTGISPHDKPADNVPWWDRVCDDVG